MAPLWRPRQVRHPKEHQPRCHTELAEDHGGQGRHTTQQAIGKEVVRAAQGCQGGAEHALKANGVNPGQLIQRRRAKHKKT